MGEALGEPMEGSWTFERALERLEKIVERLESAELSLEEALSLYEEGTHLTRYLNRELGRFEQRVRILQEEEEPSIISESDQMLSRSLGREQDSVRVQDEENEGEEWEEEDETNLPF